MINRVLSIDLETYSDLDLKKCGLYKYVQSPHFQIMLLAYAFDNDPAQLIDLTAENSSLKPTLLMLKTFLTNPEVLKTAFNAKFEVECLSKLYGEDLDYEQWSCTQAVASYAGLPGYLDGVAKALKMKAELQKARVGKALITYFCKPCKPTSKNGRRSRNLPHHDIPKWELFKEYCMQDVVVERAVRNEISDVEFPQSEQYQWVLDALINKKGVAVDLDLVRSALQIDFSHRETLIAEMIELTGLENPNSVAQLKEWVNEEDEEITSLGKKQVAELLSKCDSEKVCRVLELRQMISKTSIKSNF